MYGKGIFAGGIGLKNYSITDFLIFRGGALFDPNRSTRP